MPWSLPALCVKALLLTTLAASAWLAAASACMAGQGKPLQLEVIVNGAPVNLIGSFVMQDDGRIGAAPSELDELGIKVDVAQASEAVVLLDAIPGLRYDYDERSQKILIALDIRLRKQSLLDALRPSDTGQLRPRSDWGTVLNYNVFAAAGDLGRFRDLRVVTLSGATATLEARAFSPYGTLKQSGIVRTLPLQGTDFVRLDTSYRFSDYDRLMTHTAGDAITGGLLWTRPIRIGGLQTQSSFALRPDLITMPMPGLGGTAAVPSTVDVYLNNVKTFSQEVAAGPFSVANIPIVSGAGTARVVVRDASGHETTTTVPFYSSPNLLAPGLMSYSIEAGAPRLSYGSPNDAYVRSLVGSASLRRGIFDWLTVEGHVEAGAGVANGGAGLSLRTGTFGVASAAVAASSLTKQTGLQSYFAYETRLMGISLNASTQRTFGAYEDLASATGRMQELYAASGQRTIFTTLSSLGYTLPNLMALYQTTKAPRAIDRITIGVPLPFDNRASLSGSYIHFKDAIGNTSNIVSASYSRSLPYNASLFATAFTDFSNRKSTGLLAGLSIPLFDNITASGAVSAAPGGVGASVEVMKPLQLSAGSWGWRVRDSEGVNPYREGTLGYRSGAGRVQVSARQDGNASQASAEVEGSVVAMGGGVFLSNWIYDAFAVVNAGAPGLSVFHDNRAIGTTDSSGRLLVPTLRSYQANRISVDAVELAVDAELQQTRSVVMPADRSGVVIDFALRRGTEAALVTFVQPDGTVIPAGAAGKIGDGEDFLVGYDGQAYIRNLSASNEATIELNDGTNCRATFPFEQRPGEQVQIPSVVCQPATGTPPIRRSL